jgi:NADH-quinone oxidoreductase subunit G
VQGLQGAEMVVSLSPFKANLDIADVLLPIAPWTETPGSFVNAEGLLQSFYAVARPLGDTRPAWKVLRVLANLLGVTGFQQETAQEVLAAVLAERGLAGQTAPLRLSAAALSNATQVAPDLSPVSVRPAVASIYQLDGVVRRAPSLQLTADARAAQEAPSAAGPSQGASAPRGGSAVHEVTSVGVSQ